MATVALAERQAIYFEPETEEVYAKSFRNINIMGALAVHNALGMPEAAGVIHEVWNDFTRATAENISTDKVYGNKLRFNPKETYQKVNGQTVDKNGVPIIKMVRVGRETSQKAALEDPEMATEAVRTEGDEITAVIVDDLKPGEMYATTSMDPKRAIKHNPKLWVDKLNYSEGMAVIQVYYCTMDNTIKAGAYSVKQSDMTVFRRMFARRGVNIPEDESENRWSRHGIRKFTTQEEAEDFGDVLEAEHRHEIGNFELVYSVTKLMDKHHDIVRGYFDAYLVPLTKACSSKKNNYEMQGFAGALLNNPEVINKLDSEGRQTLMRITNGSKFTEEDGHFMEERIRYALIEELRLLLPDFMNGETTTAASPIAPSAMENGYIPASVPANILMDLNIRAAGNVGRGEQADRSYGGAGCTGAGNRNSPDDVNNELGSQDVFGGRANNEESDGDCEYVSKSCPECGEKNVKTIITKTHISGSCGCKVKK